MPGVSVRSEARARVAHIGRSMKLGLPPLWAAVPVAAVLVGGSVLLAAEWGARHLYWGGLIALALLAAVISEGSYREARRAEADHAAKLAVARQAAPAALGAAGASAPPDSLPAGSGITTGLEVVIDNEISTPFPGTGRILEIEFRVINHDPVPRPLSRALSWQSAHTRPAPDGDPEYARMMTTYGVISERRRAEMLPPRVRAGETVHGVYIATFDWDPSRNLPDYTLIIRDGRRAYEAHPR